jgi:hypothetical protein
MSCVYLLTKRGACTIVHHESQQVQIIRLERLLHSKARGIYALSLSCPNAFVSCSALHISIMKKTPQLDSTPVSLIQLGIRRPRSLPHTCVFG